MEPQKNNWNNWNWNARLLFMVHPTKTTHLSDEPLKGLTPLSVSVRPVRGVRVYLIFLKKSIIMY